MLPVYVDIDGTLTDSPGKPWGKVNEARLAELRVLCGGREVYVWSGNGSAYAQEFCRKNGLKPAACLGKPGVCVDDNPTVRPNGSIKIVAPHLFFDGGE